MSEALAFGAAGDEDGVLHWARGIVAARIKSYTRLSIDAQTDVSATFTGTSSRRLQLGERPVTAVASVTLDGTLLPVGDYRWVRAGILYRDAGWGDESRQVLVTYSYGFVVVPADLRSVVDTASLRLAANPVGWRFQTETGEGEHGASSTMVAEVPSGFTVGELMVLNRYRKRTA